MSQILAGTLTDSVRSRMPLGTTNDSEIARE